eukprot:10579165-Prorocentrum_lima.AAC.1
MGGSCGADANCTAVSTSQDIDYAMLFQELQRDDPVGLVNVMRSYNVIHGSGMDHGLVMIYRQMIMIGMQ